MVNNTSCIVFGCSKKGIWTPNTNEAAKKTLDGEVEEGTSTTGTRSFFRFPAVNPKAGPEKKLLQRSRCKRWFSAVKRKHVIQKRLKNFRICSRHFVSGSFF